VWDGHYYDFGARRIAEGFGYSDDSILGGQTIWHPWCHYPVGYSGFLAFFYFLFGAGPKVAPLVNAVTGALLAVGVQRLARHVVDKQRARIAGLLAAFDPGLVLYAALVMTEPLAALGLVSAGLIVATTNNKQQIIRNALLAGVVLGLSTLVRPQSLLCAPALGLLTLGRGSLRERALRGFKTAAVATTMTILVVLPWTARNCRVMDGCTFVSTNAGWNLAIGSFPRATGRFETLRASDGCPVVTGQVQQDRCWANEGLGWILKDPLRWLSLAPKKLSQTFDHESFPIGYLGEANPKAWPEERKAKGRGLLTTFHTALLSLAALSLVAWPFGAMALRARLCQLGLLALVLGLAAFGVWSDTHPFWPLAVLLPVVALLPIPGAPKRGGVVGYLVFAVFSVALTHVVFFGEDRYHVVITPVLCLLAAFALRSPLPAKLHATAGSFERKTDS
jgi:hypothetical protein